MITELKGKREEMYLAGGILSPDLNNPNGKDRRQDLDKKEDSRKKEEERESWGGGGGVWGGVGFWWGFSIVQLGQAQRGGGEGHILGDSSIPIK